MKRKLIFACLLIALFLCAFAISVSARDIDYNEKVTLSDGTVLPIFDENQNPLIWFILSTDENGKNTYASVPNNRNTKDDATSYVTFNINSTYGENQMHDVYIKYWDEESKSYVSYGEGTQVVANYIGIDTMWCVGTVFDSNVIEYMYYPSSMIDSGRFNGFSKLQLVDYSNATAFATFAEQTFRDCKALREVRLGAGTYDLACKNGNMFYNCVSLTTLVLHEDAVITKIGSNTFRGCKSLTGTYVFKDVTTLEKECFRDSATNEDTSLVLHFPSVVTVGESGDTHIYTDSGVEEIYYGKNLAKMALNNYNNCKRLTVIELEGVAPGFAFSSYTFRDCTALKSFCIPEGITVLPNRMFENCTSLTAVYLPSTLEEIKSGDNSFATFKSCTNMYFVSEPFTSDNIPSEPDVYYFPAGLINIASEAFDGSRLNDVVVLPVGITSLTQGFTFEGCTSKSGNPTVVFMGDMEGVNVRTWGVNALYFANPNDIDAASAGLTGTVTAYFCFGEGNTSHLCEKRIETEANCVNPKMVASYCFCGAIVGEAVTEGAPLGHEMGDEYYVFTSLIVKGKTCSDCSRCGYTEETEHEKAVLTDIGYSVKTFGEGGYSFENGYYIEKDLLQRYESANGVTVSFGVAFNAANGFDFDGTLDSFKLHSDASGLGTGKVNGALVYKMTYQDDAHLDDNLIIGIYVREKNGEEESVSFVNAQDGVFEAVSYNSVAASAQ